MIEVLRVIGASLILMMPVTMCLLAGALYIIGTKTGIIQEQ